MTELTSRELSWLTPPELAKQLRISTSKVLTWIRNGELRAVNVANRLAERPRWRISQEAREEFLQRRESSPPPSHRSYPRSSYIPDGRGKVVRKDDGRLAQNISHEERVKRSAKLMAVSKSGQGTEWRPFVPAAVARYAEKTGIEVDEEAVLSLEPSYDECPGRL